jgi:hypothetical protein
VGVTDDEGSLGGAVVGVSDDEGSLGGAVVGVTDDEIGPGVRTASAIATPPTRSPARTAIPARDSEVALKGPLRRGGGASVGREPLLL